MIKNYGLVAETGSTNPAHWIRQFDIIEDSTESHMEREATPWREALAWYEKGTSGNKELTYVIGANHGTPYRIMGHQWIASPEFDVLLSGTYVAKGLSHTEELDDEAPADEVETPEMTLQWVKEATGLADKDIGRMLGVTRPTLDAWRRGEKITTPNLRRLYAVRDILRRAARHLPSEDLLRAWLVAPRGADGQTPEALLCANQLDRARLLAMSVPSSQLARPSASTRQAVSTCWRNGAESRQEPELPEDEQDFPAVPRSKGTRQVNFRRRGS